MKKLILVFLIFTNSAFTQEAVLTSGSDETDFVNAINDANIKTITFKTNIEIQTSGITVPKSKVLRFFNGSMLVFDHSSSGSIIFENTFINAGKFRIFDFISFNEDTDYQDKTFRISGVFSNDVVFPEWFGASAIEDNITIDPYVDDAYAFQLAINLTNDMVKLSEGKYRIEHTLIRERLDDESTSGVKMVGSGISRTFILVMKPDINFIELKGMNGATGHKPLFGNSFRDFNLSGQDVASNGFVFYSSSYNQIENVEIKAFKNGGIVFDGNPNINPDLTASFQTVVKFCYIRDNKIGIFSKMNNISPQFRLANSRVDNNFRAGIIWNSSYFNSSLSSISSNGRSIANNPNVDSTEDFPLGGFYNENLDNYSTFFQPYRSKGIVIETSEFDGNYPSAITLKSSVGASIHNCSIQQTDKYIPNFKFTEKGLIKIGGDDEVTYDDNGTTKTYKEDAWNTLIQGNRISFYKTIDSTIVENNASIIRLSTWGIYTLIDNNCFRNPPGNAELGVDYKYIKEFGRANKDDYDDEDSYVRLKGMECIDLLEIENANDLFLKKFNKPNQKDIGIKLSNEQEVTLEVPLIKNENGLEVKAGSLVLSSNDPGSISCILFFRAINSPQVSVAYASNLINSFTATSSTNLSTLYAPGKLNIVIIDNGTIKIKNKYNDNLYVTITFLEKIGMYGQ